MLSAGKPFCYFPAQLRAAVPHGFRSFTLSLSPQNGSRADPSTSRLTALRSGFRQEAPARLSLAHASYRLKKRSFALLRISPAGSRYAHARKAAQAIIEHGDKSAARFAERAEAAYGQVPAVAGQGRRKPPYRRSGNHPQGLRFFSQTSSGTDARFRRALPHTSAGSLFGVGGHEAGFHGHRCRLAA